MNVSDVSALFIPHILVEEPHHPDNVRFRASISHRKGMARGVAMKGGIDGIKGPGFPRNARIITRFSQVWHKGVAKGSSYRIGKCLVFPQTVHCRKGTTNSSVLLLTGIFRPWPVRSSLTERDGNEDRKGTAIRQDQIRICRRQAVKCQDKSRVKQWRGGEGPRFSHVFHSLSREKGDGTKIDLQNRIGWKG